MSSVSAQERLDAALARIQDRNEDWHLVTHLNGVGAREAAKQSDTRRAQGKTLGALDGLIVGVKDNIAVSGLPWTGGLAGWRDRIASQDATVVARLRAAGVIILGTLNMHEGALGATTNNVTYGRAANPLDPGRTPGGSSGGSGGAVAAGFVEAALGTDTMGSVRIPAAYCGVSGLKPTLDAVPGDGLVYLSPAFDTIGPIARDVSALRAIHTAIRDPLARRETALPALDGLRVGIPRQIEDVETEEAVLVAFARARSVLEHHGARVVESDLAGWSPGSARRGGLLIVEAEAAVELNPLRDVPDGMSDDLRGLLDYGAGLTSARLVEAWARVRRAKTAVRRALCDVDVIAMPTAPQRAFAHDAPVPDNQADFTALANLAGLPAISLPVACASGLPASVQLVGPDWSELALTDLGGAIAGDLAQI